MDPIEPWVDRDELRRLADRLLAKPRPAPPPPPNDAAFGDDFVGYAIEGEGEPALGAQAGPLPGQGPPPVPRAVAPAPAPGSAPAPVAPPGPATAPPALEEPPVTPPPTDVSDRAEEVCPPMPDQSARQALAAARAIAQRGGLLVNPPADDYEDLSEPAGRRDPAPAAPPVGLTQLTQISPVPPSAEETPTVAPVSTPFLARLQAYGTWLREGIQAKAFFVLDRDGGVLIDEVQSPKLQQVARTLAQASRTANRQAGGAAIGNLHIKVAPESILEVMPVATRYGPLILGIILDQPLNSQNVETMARGLQQVIDGVPGGGAP